MLLCSSLGQLRLLLLLLRGRGLLSVSNRWHLLLQVCRQCKGLGACCRYLLL
jgi:hypothetical protein